MVVILKQNKKSGNAGGRSLNFVKMNVFHRLLPFCAFQIRIFLEYSAENYASCLVVTFRSDLHLN